MNRRGFLRALAIAGAGTALGEQISYLVRQPVSASGLVEPNTVSFTVSGLVPGDHVYAAVIDGDGLPISEVYDRVKMVTRHVGPVKPLNYTVRESGYDVWLEPNNEQARIS